MLPTHAAQAAPRAILRREGRINRCHGDTGGFRLLANRRFQLPVRPQREATPDTLALLASFARLRHVQVFQYEDAAGLRPRHETLGGNTGEILCTAGLLATLPFEDAAHGTCVLPLCLPGRQFRLQSGTGFPGLRILHLLPHARDEQFAPVHIHRNERVRFATINTHGQDASGFGDFERHAHATNHPSVAFDDGEGINLLCRIQHRAGVIGNRVRDALATRNGRNGERAVRTEIGIPPAHSDKEQGGFSYEGKGLLGGPLVAFGAEVCPGNQSERANRHLATQRAFDIMVDGSLQLHGIERCARVIARLGHVLLHRPEHTEGPSQVVVIGHQNRYASLNLHTDSIPQKERIYSVNDVAKDGIPLRAEARSPLPSNRCGGRG